MRTPVLELVIPAAVRAGAIVRALGEALDVAEGEPAVDDRVLMDSFDARLRAAGLALERAVDEADTDVWRLTLREKGRRAQHAAVAPVRTDRLLATDLPEGPVRDRLLGVLEERAALPVARVASRVTVSAVRNADAKTVVRLRLEEPEVRDGAAPVALESRLQVTGVRGYDKPFERVRGILEGEVGLKPATRSLTEEAAAALGTPAPPGKLRVKLAPGMRTDRSAQAVCRTLADHVEANFHGTIADLDPEFLHDLRVAIRRSRSVLREFKGAFPPQEWRAARDGLRWYQQVTGPTRDLDVALLEWDGLIRPLPVVARADLAPIHELIVRRREEAFEEMRLALTSTMKATVWQQWLDLLARPLREEPADDRPEAARAIAAVAGERIRDVYARMRKEGKAITDDSPHEALHDLRKRGKELRYLLELFGGLWNAEAEKPLVRALKDLQDTLGRFQDREVQADFLRGLGPGVAEGPGGPDALIALGLVIDRLGADQRDARAEFDERFARFAAKDTRKVVETAFGRAR